MLVCSRSAREQCARIFEAFECRLQHLSKVKVSGMKNERDQVYWDVCAI